MHQFPDIYHKFRLYIINILEYTILHHLQKGYLREPLNNVLQYLLLSLNNIPPPHLMTMDLRPPSTDCTQATQLSLAFC